jgi:hypothetical protein
MQKFANFLYRAFFTRDDDLDVLQVLFVAIVATTLYVVVQLTTNYTEMSEVVKVEALVTLRWLTGLMIITAVPKWMIPFIVKHRVHDIKQPASIEPPTATEEQSP